MDQPVPAKPVRPRNAASLILVRHGPKGLEVLMGKRPRRSSFAPDVFVFPGGKVDTADFLARPTRPLDAECVRRTGASPRLASALAAAALRETREETGLILPDDHSALSLVARAITPTASPIRFHARFFIADADQAEGDHADSHELTELAFRPLEETRKLALMDVTEAMLEILATAERPEPFLFTYRHGRPWRKQLG
jgi:8-oxo-dGTP pyrophosphatase MutT (NUDIX family)